MIDIHFTDSAIEYIYQKLNEDNELVLTISRKPKTSCFPMFTGNIIRLENKEDFKQYREKYIELEENKNYLNFEMYIEKRLLIEEKNEYYSTIDMELFEEYGQLYGDLFEVGILFNK